MYFYDAIKYRLKNFQLGIIFFIPNHVNCGWAINNFTSTLNTWLMTRKMFNQIFDFVVQRPILQSDLSPTEWVAWLVISTDQKIILVKYAVHMFHMIFKLHGFNLDTPKIRNIRLHILHNTPWRYVFVLRQLCFDFTISALHYYCSKLQPNT